jgi:MFS family permease
LSWHQSSVYIGTIAGSWVGAWFAERLGWRLGFYFFGSAGALLALGLYWFLREPQRGQAEAYHPASVPSSSTKHAELSMLETLRAIFRSPAAFFLLLAFLAANFVATIFLTWTPTFLVEKFGFKLTAAGLSGSVFIHAASALSVSLAGALADWLRRQFIGGRILVQGLGLLIGASFVFLVGMTQSVATLLVAMTCFGFCKGFYDSNIFASLFDVVEPRARATAAGIMNTVGWGGGALGPVAVGLLAAHGRHSSEVENMSEAIAGCALVYLAGAGLLVCAIISLRGSEIPRANS